MKHSRVLALLALLVWIAGCAGQATTVLEAQGRELDERQEAFLAAMARHDAQAVAGFFAEDAVLHLANQPAIEGRQAIEAFYGRMFGFLDRTLATPQQLRMSHGGDMAHAIGRVNNRFSSPQGVREYQGKFLIVWEYQDGQWRVSRYAVSSDHTQ